MTMLVMDGVVLGEPNFPLEDISETDAYSIRRALSDPAALTMLHRVAEQVHSHFSATHTIVSAAVEAGFFDADRSRAANIGVVAYEAMFGLVQPTAPAIDGGTYEVIYEPECNAQIVISSLQEYLDAFRTQMPNTAAAVQNVASRYVDSAIDYALLGAATSRALDLQLRYSL